MGSMSGRSSIRRIAANGLGGLMLPIGSVVIGIGLPVLWIWVGSQLQGGTTPSWVALAVVHTGLITSLIAVAGVFSWFVARDKAKAKARSDWLRGQSEDHQRKETIADIHPLERIIMFAVFVDIAVFLVWFFFFANPGVPVGQG
jgi:hypothetical protein